MEGKLTAELDEAVTLSHTDPLCAAVSTIVFMLRSLLAPRSRAAASG